MDSSEKFPEQYAAGFSAVVFTTFLANLTFETRSAFADYSLWLLCGSLPMLVIWWMQFHAHTWQRNLLTNLSGMVGYLGGYGGICLTLYHLSGVATAIFVSSTAAAIGVAAISDKTEPVS